METRTLLLWVLAVAGVSNLGEAVSWAVDQPPLDPAWQEIQLRVDVRNLSGPKDVGKLSPDYMLQRVSDTNSVWSQCKIRFVPRTVGNVIASDLHIPYEPKSQDDLGHIAGALNPQGFHNAIPLTFAGPWTFFDQGSGLYLHGLGWVFTSGNKLDRIGAMIAAQKLSDPHAGALIGHELGHALSLGHSGESDNVMAGGNRLKRDQYMQTRSFSQSVLADFMVPARDGMTTPLKVAIDNGTNR